MARCWLIYATAPRGLNARAANDALNAYISDLSRGIPVAHDHFTGTPHGGFVVIFPRDEKELARLDDPGPLAGWTIETHPLVFSLTPVGSAPKSISLSRTTATRASLRWQQKNPTIRAIGGSAADVPDGLLHLRERKRRSAQNALSAVPTNLFRESRDADRLL